MWSRKPTPVARVPAPLPSSVNVRRTSVSAVLRSIVAVRLMQGLQRSVEQGSRSLILAHTRLHRLGVHVEALRTRDRRTRCRQFGGALADVHLAHRAAKV